MDEVVERYKDMVYRIALLRVRNTWDADDVFQDVFLTYYKKNISFQDEEYRKAWLIRTTMNFAKKHSGSIWKKRVEVTENMEAYQNNSCELVFEKEEESITFQAMHQLSEKMQSVLMLYYFEEMSTKEIAEILTVREGTVRMRLSRAREELKTILESKGVK